MAKRYYSSARNTNYQVYEIVCLMRLAGMRVERTGPQTFAVRVSHWGTHTVHTMTTREILAKYKHDKQIYDLLRSHPKAHTIPVAPVRKKRVYPPRRHRSLVG